MLPPPPADLLSPSNSSSIGTSHFVLFVHNFLLFIVSVCWLVRTVQYSQQKDRRMRSFAHVEDNYALHVFIPWSEIKIVFIIRFDPFSQFLCFDLLLFESLCYFDGLLLPSDKCACLVYIVLGLFVLVVLLALLLDGFCKRFGCS